MACDTNNQPPRDTDHQKYATDVGGDIFATKLDRSVVFVCVCFGKEKHLYGSGLGPGVELCLNSVIIICIKVHNFPPNLRHFS